MSANRLGKCRIFDFLDSDSLMVPNRLGKGMPVLGGCLDEIQNMDVFAPVSESGGKNQEFKKNMGVFAL